MMIFCSWNQGFRIVLHPMYQNGGGLYQITTNYQIAMEYVYQMDIKYIEWPYGHYFPFQGPPKFTKIGIFGSKIYVPSGNPGLNGFLKDGTLTLYDPCYKIQKGELYDTSGYDLGSIR
jgi:hypothetical protein